MTKTIIMMHNISQSITAQKVSKYGVFSGTYFPAFGVNAEIYGVNYVFGHFSRNVYHKQPTL